MHTNTNTVYCRLMRKYKINTHRCLRLARAYKIKTKMRWNLEEILCSVYREVQNALCTSQKTDWFQSYHYCFFYFFFLCQAILEATANHLYTHTCAAFITRYIHTHVRTRTCKSEQACLYLVFRGGSSVSLHCLRRKQQHCFVLPQTTGRCL